MPRDTDPSGLVADLCRELGPVLGVTLEAIAAQAVRGADGIVGLLVLREHGHSGTAVHSAAVRGRNRASAVFAAVVEALGAEESLLVAAASRWGSAPGVRAVTVADSLGVRSWGDNRADTDLQLVRAMPGRGRMTVRTGSGSHQVLRLPNSALVLTVGAGTPTTEAHCEQWMAVVEEAVGG